MPDFWSSVAKQSAKAWISSSLATARGTFSPGVEGALGVGDGEGRVLRDLLGGGAGLGEERVGREHPVCEADGERLRGVDGHARVDELAGLADAHAAREALRAAEARDHPEAHLGLPEAGLARSRR
jgi:hypothetical protein